MFDQKTMPWRSSVTWPPEYVSDYDDFILAEARNIAQRRLERIASVTDPYAAREFFIARYAGLEDEQFGCLFTDAQHQGIAFDIMFRGSLTSCEVHPREIAKRALYLNAAAVILTHNHPSGVPEPSAADRVLTARIVEALALVQVRVLDHLIVGGSSAVSMAERGML